MMTQLQVLGGLAIVGAIAVPWGRVGAQITPDDTLGKERSVVIPLEPDSPVDAIAGGAKRGANLFHSFREFNVGEGRGAYFSNPNGVENIFSRVTGGSRSEIGGTLGVSGEANLFLINPNGILFGSNASLDVKGSFVGTTANGIGFGDRGFFSATNPEVPSQRLTVNPSAFFFNQLTAESIENRSTASAGLDPSGSFDTFGLRVPDGQSLLLLGGDVTINGGGIVAFGGRVELGGVRNGTVGLNVDSEQFSFNFPDNVPRAEVSLTNNAGVIVASGGGGSITITAADINTLEGSSLTAGILNNLGAVDAQAGDITLNATEAVTVTNSSIFNSVQSSAVGNAGNLTIETKRLSILNGGQVAAITFGKGNAGNLTVRAAELIDLNAGEAGTLTGLFNQVSKTGNGMGGNTLLEARRLSILNGAQVAAITFGKGKVGDLTVQASEMLEIRGRGDFQSGIFSEVGPRSSETVVGNGGNLTVETKSLILSDQAKISTEIGSEAVGTGSNLNIVTSNLVVRDNSNVSAQTYGKSNAGSINIATDNLSGTNGSQISSSTFGRGNAGSLTINADTISFDGVNSAGNPSGAFSIVEENGEGNGGRVNVTTGSLSLTNGGQLSTLTFGEGNAGNLNVRVFGSAEITGNSTRTSSGLFASAIEGTGNGGNLTLVADQLVVKDGATVSVSNFPSRNLRTPGSGAPGNLRINAGSLLLDNGGTITAATAVGSVEENTGDILIDVRDILEANNSNISATSERSSGSAVNITAGDIRLREDSDIRTNVASGAGGGGDITLKADSILAFDDSDILAFARNGVGGDIQLKTPVFFGSSFQPAPEGTDPDTLNGNDRVDINASGAVSGEVSLPDVSFVQNSLTELTESTIDTETLIANSCVVPSGGQRGTFIITGAGGLPVRPGDAAVSPYPTGTVRSVPNAESSLPGATRPWQKGDPIIEPTGTYRLANGKLVMSRECSQR